MVLFVLSALAGNAVELAAVAFTLCHRQKDAPMSCNLSATNEAAQSADPEQPLQSVPVEQAWFGLCVFALLLVTLPLWLAHADFPCVPMIRGFEAGRWLNILLFLVAVLSLSMLMSGFGLKYLPRTMRQLLIGEIDTRELRAAVGRTAIDSAAKTRPSFDILRGVWIALLLAFSLFALTDQNKLQPWIWHALLVSAYSISTCRNRDWWRCGMIVLTVSIYFWSAISKFDDSFATTYGQQLIEAMLGPDRVMPFRMLKAGDRELMARLLPSGELLTAVLLLVPVTRRFGCALSIVMHLGLMLAVGPLGLNHRAGVFLWNIYFIGQNALLWRFDVQTRRHECSQIAGPTSQRSRMQLFLPLAVLVFAAAFPALRSLRLCDNWPAWAVYASDIEFATIYVSDSGLARLPQRIREFAEPQSVKTGWTPIRIEQWALAECHAPIYPQDRFSIAVALALVEQHQLTDEELLVNWRGRPVKGTRGTITLRGATELRRFTSRYWLNVEAGSRMRDER